MFLQPGVPFGITRILAGRGQALQPSTTTEAQTGRAIGWMLAEVEIHHATHLLIVDQEIPVVVFQRVAEAEAAAVEVLAGHLAVVQEAVTIKQRS
ncbi:MAG: hypothetical protein UZ12_BCD005000513 [Bacteroidetes bacterium OLB12]|nr:MAG: hypothetical protein UZ12_BCD005000513 [Bacteroidetes bacterium OLB12]